MCMCVNVCVYVYECVCVKCHSLEIINAMFIDVKEQGPIPVDAEISSRNRDCAEDIYQSKVQH